MSEYPTERFLASAGQEIGDLRGIPVAGSSEIFSVDRFRTLNSSDYNCSRWGLGSLAAVELEKSTVALFGVTMLFAALTKEPATRLSVWQVKAHSAHRH